MFIQGRINDKESTSHHQNVPPQRKLCKQSCSPRSNSKHKCCHRPRNYKQDNEPQQHFPVIDFLIFHHFPSSSSCCSANRQRFVCFLNLDCTELEEILSVIVCNILSSLGSVTCENKHSIPH